MWCPTNAPCTVGENAINPRIALIAALDNDGRVYFAMTHSNTDSDVMILFLSNLIRKLNTEIPDWRENSVILLDGAKYHTSDETRIALKKL